MGHRTLFEAAQNSAFGTLRHMRIQWSSLASNAGGWRAKSEAGRWWALAGVGTHCLDQIRWFMIPQCGEITRAESIINRKVFNGPHDETALLTYQFENGSTAELCASVLYKGPRIMELYGSDGYAICTETLGPHGAGPDRDPGRQLRLHACQSICRRDRGLSRRHPRRPSGGSRGREGAANVDLLLRAVGA